MTAKTIDEYLEGVPADQRAALETLRQQILEAAPDARECISYAMPAFRRHGVLVWMAAAKPHCALYPKGLTPEQRAELAAYDTSKGTIRFTPDKPLPADLVRAIVQRRVREDDEAAAARRKRPQSG
jgi:uncharacterized protein YdhG (YjbR/CyaY superfamily)